MLMQAQRLVRPVLLSPSANRISTVGASLRSPFLEPIGSICSGGLQSILGKSKIPSKVTPSVTGRFIHGTSARSLESIEKNGIRGQFFLTTDPNVAWNYAKKQADFDDSEKVIVVVDVDPSKMMKNEFDQYFITGGAASIKKTIKYSKKDTPECAADLSDIAARDAAGLRCQLQVLALILVPSLFLMI